MVKDVTFKSSETHVYASKCMVDGLHMLNNPYLVFRDRLGVIGSHYKPLGSKDDFKSELGDNVPKRLKLVLFCR